MKRFVIIIFVLSMTMFTTARVSPATCWEVTIGEMNWGSAQVIANIEKFILVGQLSAHTVLEALQTPQR